MMTDTKQAVNQLTDDLRAVMGDAEELLNAITGQTGEEIVALRSRTEGHLRQLRQKLGDMESRVLNRTKAAVRATDQLVHDNPWRSILIASGVGLLFGIVAGRR